MMSCWEIMVIVVELEKQRQKIIVQHFLLVYSCLHGCKHSMYRGRCLSSSIGGWHGHGPAIEVHVWMKLKTRKRRGDGLPQPIPKRMLCLLFGKCALLWAVACHWRYAHTINHRVHAREGKWGVVIGDVRSGRF